MDCYWAARRGDLLVSHDNLLNCQPILDAMLSAPDRTLIQLNISSPRRTANRDRLRDWPIDEVLTAD